ncbi:hypothetical protein JKP88DRAFT_243908 [Tribonema minus]|uniref:Uncharacterized protein n=1 Tax=Tribonema minus TaxID=303371 RepID=A0A835Z9L8_9STRA|nr:hypothetical protein JKP88DRAFT_243908 [Tribonema minus]
MPMEPVVCMQLHQYNAGILREHIRWIEAEMSTSIFRDSRECADRIFRKIESSDSHHKARQLVDKLRELAARVTRQAHFDQVTASSTTAPVCVRDNSCSDFCKQWVNGDDAYHNKQCIEVCWLGWNPGVGDDVGGGYVVVRKSLCFGHGLVFRHVAIGKPVAVNKTSLRKCTSALSTLGGLGALMRLTKSAGSQLASFVGKALRCSNLSLLSCMALLLMISTFKLPSPPHAMTLNNPISSPDPVTYADVKPYAVLNETQLTGAKRSVEEEVVQVELPSWPGRAVIDSLVKRHRW